MQPLLSQDPSHVGQYRLVGRLGAGGMGVVYVAQNARGAPVAVKTVRRELLRDREIRERFSREVHAAIRVASPYTAQVLDADLLADPPYLVTEYVAGSSLLEVVRTSGPLTGDALTGFAAGVAAALVGIHAAGVVHRDLTPANVLLAADGPRVIDLGIAQVIEDTGLTRTGTTVGTAGFLAPERIREAAGPASDVFSWAALVTFAATGVGPFGTGPADAVLYRTVHEEPNLDGVPDTLVPIVREALTKDPHDRPTATELVARITGHDSSDPAAAATATAPLVDTAAWPTTPTSGTAAFDPEDVPTAANTYAQHRPAGRRRLLGVAVVTAVLLAGGTVALLALTNDNRNTPQDAAAPTQGASEPDDPNSPSPTPTPATDQPTTAESPSSPTVSEAPARPDPATVDLTDELPAFHEQVHRRVVPREGVEDAVLIVSGPRSGEPRPLEASLFEWDRGDYRLADNIPLDCGYLEAPISDDEGPTVYVACTGGASARWLYALQPHELDLKIFPDTVHEETGEYTGWAFSAWDRIDDPDGPDDLVLSINTCTPSCADGAYLDYLLEYDDAFGTWNATECSYPDGESVPFGPMNAVSTSYIPSIAPC